ncbi:MAG: aminoacyl-tRNA hydrolase [Clostridia bacterium]|nr:aminoacyl-tRNA hydrolase [Clostridia bacterium]
MADIFDLFKQITQSTISSEPISYLVVGLGNPGSEYSSTRHNAGFIAIDCIARKSNCNINRAKFKGLCADTSIGGKRVLLLKPQTYMNLSGESVLEAVEFYKIPTENIIVLCDDVNFDVGTTRIRAKGSDGGQKGMRSIIKCLGTDNIKRIKLGVGKKPTPEYDMADWVLSKFTSDEQIKLQSVAENVYDAVTLILSDSIEKAMSKYN